MRIKLAIGVSVLSTGTWELKGIYGRYNYNDDTLYHWVDLLGTSIIDSVRSKETIASEANWNYDDLLGEENYHILTTFGNYLKEGDFSGSTYGLEFNLSNGTTTYSGTQNSHSMTISN